MGMRPQQELGELIEKAKDRDGWRIDVRHSRAAMERVASSAAAQRVGQLAFIRQQPHDCRVDAFGCARGCAKR
eukprot:COSAG04_NODE_6772_length_1260_cov_1.645995_2_plen_73_part_00